MIYSYERFSTAYGGIFFRIFKGHKEMISYLSSKNKAIQLCEALFGHTPIDRKKVEE